jgi:hypothetical protein
MQREKIQLVSGSALKSPFRVLTFLSFTASQRHQDLADSDYG